MSFSSTINLAQIFFYPFSIEKLPCHYYICNVLYFQIVNSIQSFHSYAVHALCQTFCQELEIAIKIRYSCCLVDTQQPIEIDIQHNVQ